MSHRVSVVLLLALLGLVVLLLMYIPNHRQGSSTTMPVRWGSVVSGCSGPTTFISAHAPHVLGRQ